MKRTEAMAVGDILKAMMDSEGDTAEFDRQKASYLWSEIVGEYINRQTVRRFVTDDTLHVFIASGPLKSELAFMLPSINKKLNEAIGKRIIKKIQIH